MSSTVGVKVNCRLNPRVVFDWDDALFHCGFSTHVEEFNVASPEVAFLIEPSRFDTIGPRTIESSSLFVAVIISAVVNIDWFVVRILLWVLFESSNPGRSLRVKEILEMRGFINALFQLSSDIVEFPRGKYPSEPCLRVHRWIIHSPYEHARFRGLH